ncbi:MAG: serine/threonine-protein kinase [Pseudomonadota bacterium]
MSSQTRISSALPPGARVHEFEVQRVVGSGGFGITYSAFDTKLERQVALKEFYPRELARREADNTTVKPTHDSFESEFQYGLDRFLSEAQTMAQFRHPNIVHVHGYVEAHGTAYLVMDFEHGTSLAHEISRNGVLSDRDLEAIIRPVLEGLQVVHTKRYLHRDIKPENIILRQDRTAVLLDFGAARRAMEGRNAGLTIMFTPGYAPFEQYSAQAKQGPWTDIYATGATMYFCLVGKPPPLATDRVASLDADRPDPVVEALKALAPKHDLRLLRTIHWMMKPRAKDRPKRVEQVLRVMRGEVVTGQGSDTNTRRIEQAAVSPNRRAPNERRPTGRDAAPPVGRATLGGIDDATIDKATKELATLLGPVARVLVRQAAERARDRGDFVAQLAAELDDETERGAFTKAMRQ